MDDLRLKIAEIKEIIKDNKKSVVIGVILLIVIISIFA